MTQPYTWAIEVLRRRRTERNAKTPDQIFLQREKAKDKIKEITINHCSYDIEEFFKRFDRVVMNARSIGCVLTDTYLITLFAEGCSSQRAFESRTAIVHLEPEEKVQTNLL